MSGSEQEGRVESKLTTFGFEWGACRVTRLSELPRGRVVIGIRTDHVALDLYVSKTGRSVRVFRGGEELRPAPTPPEATS